MPIQSNIHNYKVRFGDAAGFLGRLEAIPERTYVVDQKVWELYSKGSLKRIDPKSAILLPADEERKSLDSVLEIYDRLLGRSAKRNLTLISIGGGITQDIAGFAASTLYRGLRWIHLPTTLLAQADSCIGGKTALNYKGYKNLVGTFYPPHEVLIDPTFLATLSGSSFYSGLGEVIKQHLMGGERATQALLEGLEGIKRRDPDALVRAISTSLEIKRDFIQGDEFSLGRRNLLNYGHCYGHALESTSGFEVPHGQAVLIGILFADIVARNRGLLSPETCAFFRDRLLLPHILQRPTAEQLDADRIHEAMKKDKKRTGEGLALVMMTDGYSLVMVEDLRPEELAEAADELRTHLLNKGDGRDQKKAARKEKSLCKS